MVLCGLFSAEIFALPNAFDSSKQDQLTVSGIVTDTNGMPLPGVTVLEEDTSNGVVTDFDGNFTIEVSSPQSVLVFTFVGMVRAERIVGDNRTMNVQMGADAQALEEVVVTALGIKRERKSLTYAAQTLKGDDISEAKDVNMINNLQGKSAGVVITKSATGPGGEAKVIIRGNRSISGSSEPLYVVDGVPLIGGIGMLNADNVESMTILKGASAAALYGSQGQNGAIIITTKRGKIGEITVNYVGGLTFSQAAVLPDLQFEYGQGDAGIYSPNSEHSWGPETNGQSVTLWNGNTVPLEGDTDRFKNFFRIAPTLNNTIAVTGGSEKMQTYFSYGNTDAKGIMPNNDLSRHNIDLKIDNVISSKLSFSTKFTYVNESVDNRVSPGEGGTYALPSLFRTPTSIPTSEMENYSYIDETGTERQSYWKPGSSILLNPYWAMNRISTFQTTDRILGLFAATYKFTDWLDVQLRGSLDKSIRKSNRKIWNDNYFSLVGSDYSYSTSREQGINVDALVSFTRDLTENLKISGNLGAALQQGQYESINGDANGLNKANYFFMNNAANPFVTDRYGEYPQVQSLYGTVNLEYKNYLFFDVTGRNDWSSALPEESRSYFYPSLGVSAIVSEMMELPSWITYGKARATYASSGYGGSEYLGRNYYSVGAGGLIITPSILSLGNYKPEITTSYEVGMDWRFFNNRFGLNLTYYDTRTKNQLLLIGAPSASLFAQKYINAGLISNNGIEVVANATPIRGENFSWDATINFAHNNNEIIKLTETVSSAILRDDRMAQIVAEEGGSFGDMYVKGWKRDELGRRLVDEEGAPLLTSDRSVFLGNYNPDYMVGFSNTFKYSDFSLRFLIDARIGGYVISGTQALMDSDGHSARSLEGRENGLVLDAYTVDGNRNTQSVDAQTYWSTIGDRYPTGELYAYSASNVRLRELVFGYQIPGDMGFFKDARVSIVGRDLFFFYKPAPVDPEVTLGTSAGGLEYAALPSTRTLGLNLNLTF